MPAVLLTVLVLFAGCGLGHTKRKESSYSYTVKPGDTLTSIAALHQTDVESLARLNGIRNPDQIACGQILRLPECGGDEPLLALGGVQRIAAKGIPVGKGSGKGRRSHGSFVWPVEGKPNLTSGYGPRWGRMHRGLDFGAPAGTAVRAAARGQVVHVGQSGIGPGRSYGNYCVVHHGGGLYTLYAHMKNITVQEGQVVQTMRKIGEVGSTGRSTGPHLHFEVIEGIVEVDPLSYLPEA